MLLVAVRSRTRRHRRAVAILRRRFAKTPPSYTRIRFWPNIVPSAGAGTRRRMRNENTG